MGTRHDKQEQRCSMDMRMQECVSMMAARMSVVPADTCAASAQMLQMWLSCLMSCSKSGLEAARRSGRM